MDEAKMKADDARAASIKYVEDQQEKWSALSSAAMVGMGDKGVVPPLPAPEFVPAISGAEKARLASQEYCVERSEKAKRLPAVRQAEALAVKRLEAVSNEIEKATAKLQQLQADRDHLADNADARLLLTQKLELLNKDLYALGMARQGQGSLVVSLEDELRDGLVKWAEARAAWCRAAVPVILEAQKIADEIVAWKAEEVRTGKPYSGGMKKRAVQKKYGPVTIGPMRKMS